MTVYILFMIVGQFNYATITTQEFNSFDACKTAYNTIIERDNEYHHIKAFCIAK